MNVPKENPPEQPEKKDTEAWARFERAVDVVIKSGPKHRQRPRDERKERPFSKGRVHKGRTRD